MLAAGNIDHISHSTCFSPAFGLVVVCFYLLGNHIYVFLSFLSVRVVISLGWFSDASPELSLVNLASPDIMVDYMAVSSSYEKNTVVHATHKLTTINYPALCSLHAVNQVCMRYILAAIFVFRRH